MGFHLCAEQFALWITEQKKTHEIYSGGSVMLEGCQGKPRTPTIIEKVCPQCGHLIELFSIDTQMPCENCGFVAYNDTLSCVQWCQYARKCVGDEMYEHMMEIAAMQKSRK